MNLDLGDSRLIIETCKRQGLLRNQTAYCLATVFHETAHTMKPVREYGGEKYLKSKAYYPYVGMGYVQLTWEANYKLASQKLGVDFIKSPRLLLQPQYAAPICVIGMKEGWFTKKKLSDYITLSKSDFRGARRIINGTDKAAMIASYAEEYDKLLKADGYGEETVKPTPKPKPIPAPQPVPPKPPIPDDPGVEPSDDQNSIGKSIGKSTGSKTGIVAAVLLALAGIGTWITVHACQWFGLWCGN